MNNRNRERVHRIGEVYVVKFYGVGSVQKGLRPALVFQNNVGNTYSPNVIVLPITCSIKKAAQPTHVVVRACDSGFRKDSMVLCENPQSIPKDQLGEYITTLSDSYMRQIAAASLLATSAIAFLNLDLLSDLIKKAEMLNSLVQL